LLEELKRPGWEEGGGGRGKEDDDPVEVREEEGRSGFGRRVPLRLEAAYEAG